MGTWDDALRSAMCCPKCGAYNEPGRSAAIEVEHEVAVCSVCSHHGPIASFIQKEK
jgi:hypothetical protein